MKKILITLFFLTLISFSIAEECPPGQEKIISYSADKSEIFEGCCEDLDKPTCVWGEGTCYYGSFSAGPWYLCFENNWYDCNRERLVGDYYCDYEQRDENGYSIWIPFEDYESGCFGENSYCGICLGKNEYCGLPCTPKCVDNPISNPDYEGTPYNQIQATRQYTGKCSEGICVERDCNYNKYSYSSDCFTTIQDTDLDGVPDEYDRCKTPFELRNFEVDEYGCAPSDYIVETECSHLFGTGSNINFVVFPCGFDVHEKVVFEYWSKKISDIIQRAEPYNSYPNEYSVYYVWSTEKEGFKGYSGSLGNQVEDSSKKCHSGKEASKSMIDQVCGNLENQIIIDVAHNSAEAGADYEFSFAIVSEGTPWCCGILENCCSIYEKNELLGYGEGSVSEDMPYMVLHEIGHLFKLGHSTGFVSGESLIEGQFKDYTEDLYSPIVYPISEDNYVNEPCPIWDFPEVHYWADLFGQSVGCYQGYWDYKHSYSILNYEMEWTTMTTPREPPFIYSPISARLIEIALTEGYENFISMDFPNKCEDFEDQTIREECLVKACKYVEEDRKEECCKGTPIELGIDPEIDESGEATNPLFIDCMNLYS